MPLFDHFHPPLKDVPPWESVATMWTGTLARWLNRILPQDDFIAYPTIHLGTEVEADVAEYDKRGNGHDSSNGNVATLTEAPPAILTIPAVFPDDIEVRVGTSRNDLHLCGVIELLSESNKKEVAAREAFANKCAAYLQRGIGVVVVDVVTNRLANLHNQILRLIGGPNAELLADNPPNYVAAYRPLHHANQNTIEVWPYVVTVGDTLPLAPFALRRGPTLMLDLEGSYMEATRDIGIR